MRRRSAIAFAICLFVTPSLATRLAVKNPGPGTVRTLSFSDRVRAQEAIERVYYTHQIGATKPFEEAVPRAIIEDKVRRYLAESAALETFWNTPITDAALQRELERMAGGTRLPDRLKEVFDALGNDAFLIKECVARATLADRLAHNFYAYDPRYHAAARAAINALHDQIASGALSPTADNPHRTIGEIAVDPTSDAAPSAQGLAPSTNPVSPSAVHAPPSTRPVAPQTGRQLSQADFAKQRAKLPPLGQVSSVVESREAFSFNVVLSETATSARVASYVVPKITWDAWMSGSGASLRPSSVAAVATDRGPLPTPNQGATFDPNANCIDGWNNGILDDEPEARSGHLAVWTGSVMLVWGGSNSLELDTGGRYDPLTDTWQSMTTVNAPRGRSEASAVWTGSEMIVWGGREMLTNTLLVSGGRYDPIADRWTRMSLAPSARRLFSVVWTGNRMIVWGGYIEPPGQFPQYLSTGEIYDPSSDTWTPTATEGAPSGLEGHTAVWTGREMIVWSGGDGGRYNPSTDTWSAMAPTSQRWGHVAVWTGSTMVIWGGWHYVPCPYCPGGRNFEYLNTGERYDPVRNVWIGMSSAGAPYLVSDLLTAWTGHFMLVLDNGGTRNAGGLYDPSTDHWTPTATIADSLPRQGSSLVWTGSQAILWGGAMDTDRGWAPANTGGRYDPWSDTWTPTAASGPGSQRSDHSAVWTGNEMVVWGGKSLTSYGYLDSGGRYDPAVDSWTGMTAVGAPVPRSGHTALWTGGEMLVWGGFGSDGNLGSGGRYDVGLDRWTAISLAGAPSPRTGHVAVWTGHRMVVWGGTTDQSGGAYDPATDAWSSTSLVNAPSARLGHTAVWTGSRVVVWGGFDGSAYPGATSSGGRYDPEADAWTPTSLVGAPSPRAYHTAVWVGDRMIVWGGEPQGYPPFPGARYDPVGDTWSPISNVGAPRGRDHHSAVAAGSLMLVWGGYSGDGFAPFTGGIYDAVNDRWTKLAKLGPYPWPSSGTIVWTGDAMIVWTGMSGSRFYLGHDVDCDGDGVSNTAGDCDDHNPATYPGATERCDGVANVCDNEWWPQSLIGEDDLDRDGWMACAGDCNDNDERVHPGAKEVCDGVDDDCDGQLLPPGEADDDQDGYRVCDGDCDDHNPYVHPGAYDYCDGLDNDCNGVIDDHGDAFCNRPDDPCHVGVCGGTQGCVFTTPEIPCDDHNVCTVDDTCHFGECFGTPTDGTPCDDGLQCTVGDTCHSGNCFGAVAVGAPCDDGNECTVNDVCNTYGGCGGEAAAGAPCDDNNVCTSGERCIALSSYFAYCGGGAPIDCAQDDGNACNGTEACTSESGCFHANAPLCDDGNICTDDSCDPATGCRYVPNTAPCDDGNACTTGDTCGGGTCHAGTAVACDDGNVCTDDSCVPWAGCVHTNNTAACDDASACTRWDACEGGVCVGHDPVVCAAGDQCLDVAACDPATGLCVAAAKPDGTACDDGDLCTGGETCRAGICTPAYSGLSAPNPRNNGYYKSLCHSPQSGDTLTVGDAACAATLTRTFAGVKTAADVCAELTPSHPNGDACDRAEGDLMTLALNICRARVCTAQRIDSQCGSDDTVGRSLAEIDAILADPGRSRAACDHAKCLADEINTGRALAAEK
jgi:N-acetylneuraminic acid mutarotase